MRSWKTCASALLLIALSAQAGQRSAAAVSAFKRGNPCPATGERRGGCPGYVVDHVQPLCAGGPDHPANMQWQTLPESLRKDAEERRECRKTRVGENPRK